MVRKLLSLLFALSAGLQAATSAPAHLSLAADNAPVVQILQALAETEALNLLIAPGVEGHISLQLRNVSWKQAFQAITEGAGLHWRQENAILHVYPQSWPAQQQARQEALRQQRQRNQPLSSLSVALRYADAEALAASIQGMGEKLTSPQGSIMVDKRTNRLLLRDNASALRQLQQWINLMDIPLGQVELSAHIVTINQQRLRELGVKWNSASPPDEAGSAGRTLSADFAASGSAARVGFTIGRIDARLLALELSALEQQQQLEIIASPRLLASHQQPASIKQGSEIPYQVSGGENGVTAVEFKEAVLGMEVTPVVGLHGNLRLKLRISQNMPGQVIKQADGEALAIDKQEIETQVEVKDGETLALGGIFQQKNSLDNQQVPWLGNIPLLGRLFRHEGKEREKRELVVFITPRLLKAE